MRKSHESEVDCHAVMLLRLLTLTFSSDIANLPSDVEPNVAMPRSPKDCRMRKRDDNTSPCSFQSFGRNEWICSEVPSGSLGLSPSASHGSGSWNPTNINKRSYQKATDLSSLFFLIFRLCSWFLLMTLDIVSPLFNCPPLMLLVYAICVSSNY